jgi:hypothetical protein
MDIFTEKRYTVAVIGLLVVMNIVLMAVLWLGRPEAGRTQFEQRSEVQQEQMLADELGFNREQFEEYQRERQLHREEIQRLNHEIRRVKKEMFDQVLHQEASSTISDSLLTQAQQKQAEIERLTYRYLFRLREICTPEQRVKLNGLLHEMMPAEPGGRIGARRPPPPPRH